MNIAFLVNYIDMNVPEATKISVFSLAKELNKKNNVIIISKRQKELKNFEILEGVKVYRFNKFLYPIALFIVQKKQKIKFDIVQLFSSAPIKILDALLIRIFSKTKIVHNIKSHSKHFFGSYLFSPLLNIANLVITNSKIIKKKLRKNGCFVKIKIIRSPVDLKKFKPLKVKKNNTILYYGPFAKRKGVEYLLRIVPEINKKFKNVNFKFLCKHDSYDRKLYQPLINKINKYNNVFIKIGKTKNLVKEINKASIAIFPYPNLIATEANPLSIIECIACKTPVITSELPEIKELFNKNEILFFKPSNESDLLNKTLFALKNKKKLISMVERSNKKVKNFSLNKIKKQFLNTYYSLLE